MRQPRGEQVRKGTTGVDGGEDADNVAVVDDALTLRDEQAVWASGMLSPRCAVASNTESWLFLHHWEGSVDCLDDNGKHLGGTVSFQTLFGDAKIPGRAEVRYDFASNFAIGWAVAAAPGRWRWILARASILLLVLGVTLARWRRAGPLRAFISSTRANKRW